MKILITLHKNSNKFITSIDDVLQGKIGCSGSTGSAIRLAELLFDRGFEVCLSASFKIPSSKIPCILHDDVLADKFDRLIVLHTHWNGAELSFGNQALSKTILWAQNHLTLASAYNFFGEGGIKIVCLSYYHANISRALPQWRSRLAVAYNTYSPIFCPPQPKSDTNRIRPQLLFVGAISKAKGLVELTKIWSYLAQQQVDLDLAIAGSVSLHNKEVEFGPTGVAAADFDRQYLQPWLRSLPTAYQPRFLGSLDPHELKHEINNSWAIIVNPGGVPETFCVAAVDAQACNKTVFSVKSGALVETVYQGDLPSLSTSSSPEAVGNLIIRGLNDPQKMRENGERAGDYVRSKFSQDKICRVWLDLLAEIQEPLAISYLPANTRDAFCDLTRITNTSILLDRWLKNRKSLISS